MVASALQVQIPISAWGWQRGTAIFSPGAWRAVKGSIAEKSFGDLGVHIRKYAYPVGQAGTSFSGFWL